MENGLEQKMKPPLKPKPSRLRPGGSGQSEAQLHSSSPNDVQRKKKFSFPVSRSPSSASSKPPSATFSPVSKSSATSTATPNDSPNPVHRSASNITSSLPSAVGFPSCYSSITLIPSSPPGRGSPANTSAGSGGRESLSTTSSEPPSSPSGILRQDFKSSTAHNLPLQPSFSFHSEEEEQFTSSLTRVYPSPSYSLDSRTVLFSPPPMSPARDVSSDTLSLQELVEKHSQSFPLQIKVVHGYIGQISQLTIASGDYYNIHFVKHQEVVSMTDKLGLQYTIPLNSSFQFGLVYSEDPSTHEEQIFQKVAHLISLSPLPRVACATRDVRGSDEKNAITAREILVLKRVIRPKLRRKSLEVLSLKTQTTKTLPLDCEGHFSLSPQQNQIYLLELVRCIPDTFPCKAKMFLSSDAASNSQRTSHSLLHAVITLTGQKTETSLIASSVTFTGSDDQNGETGAQVNEHLVDIPVDERLSGVAVSVVDTSECGLQEILNHRTRTLFETFDVTRVKSWYDPVSEDAADLTQSLLYATIGRRSAGVGVRVDKPMAAFARDTLTSSGSPVEKPEVVYETVYSPTLDHRRGSPSYHSTHRPSNEFAAQYEQPSIRRRVSETASFSPSPLPPNISDHRPHPPYDPLPSVLKPIGGSKSLHRSKSHYTLPPDDLLMADCYEDMHPAVVSPSPRPAPDNSPQKTNSKLEQLVATTASLQTQLTELTRHVSSIEEQLKDVAQMNAVMKRLLEGISALTLQANHLRGVQGLSRGRGSAVFPVSSRSEAQAQQNRLNLGTLDLPQVECLLRAMGLPQYIPRFHQEQVTGSVLLQCNEAILAGELGVESQLHRKRLLSVIAGHLSATDVLSHHSTHTL